MVKKLLKQKKKGELNGLVAVFCTMIFLMLFAGLADIIAMSNRSAILTDTAKELARTLSVQGGALEHAPQGYGERTYYTNEELGRLVEANMKKAGFGNSTWSVDIDYTRTYDEATNAATEDYRTQQLMGYDGSGGFFSDPTSKIDYLSNFTITIKGEYKWPFLSPVLGQRKTKLQSVQPGTSEWRYEFDYWPGELIN